MINVRKKAFETNSSSMHTFIICNEYPDNMETYSDRAELVENYKKEKVLMINDIDFSAYCDGDMLCTWPEKLAYVTGYLASKCYDKSEVKELKTDIMSAVYEHYPEIKKIKMCEIEPCECYINHQSIGNMETFLDEHYLTWQELVFDPRYVIDVTSDGTMYEDILNHVLNLGYKNIEDMTAWSVYKVKDDKEVEDE